MSAPATDDQPATVESAAGLDFAPWSAEDLAGLPGAKQWINDASVFYLAVRISASLLGKTKAEMVELVETQETDTVIEMLERIESAIDAYSVILKLLEAAQARLIVAGAAAAQRAGARS